MNNKLDLSTRTLLASFFLFCCVTDSAIAESAATTTDLDVRQNYAGNQKAVSFAGSGAAAADKEVSSADLEAKKQELRKKTLTNYADFADKPLVKPRANAKKEVTSKKIIKVEREVKTNSRVASSVSSRSPILSSLAGVINQSQSSQSSVAKSSAAAVEPTSQEKLIKVIKSEKTAVEVEKVEPIKEAVEAEKEVTVVKPRPAPKDPSCVNAELEAERARNATTQADKLFYLRRASRLCTSFAGYHIEIGQVYAALGRKEDARFSYNKALELEPNNAEIKALISGLNKQ
jgi:tetratricopeptide (TPR) repeat protein